jgi:hypothetical protein
MSTNEDDRKVIAIDRARELKVLKTKYGINYTTFADIGRAPHKKHLIHNFLGAGVSIRTTGKRQKCIGR